MRIINWNIGVSIIDTNQSKTTSSLPFLSHRYAIRVGMRRYAAAKSVIARDASMAYLGSREPVATVYFRSSMVKDAPKTIDKSKNCTCISLAKVDFLATV